MGLRSRTKALASRRILHLSGPQDVVYSGVVRAVGH